ncbi:MFS transporter [Nocardiopsis sp. NPDC058631]|uniref:MFS transporter n=1 Tax=Nocardiopsis sp. NPDC058631 TaxID=3346566 RepID=UPI00365B2C83
MRGFSLVWAGQFLSVIGSGTAWFAVTLWVWGESGSATLFALLTLFSLAPGLAVAPVAGVVVDRCGRRAAILVGDTVLAATSCTVLVLYLNGGLEIWHLYVIAVVEGVMESLHMVAYSALVPLLVPEAGLVRANGMISLAGPGSEILAPALGGVLLRVADLSVVLALDLFTFGFAVLTLLAVRVPEPGPDRAAGRRDARGGPREGPRPWSVLRADLAFGFLYIARRRGLWTLLALFFVLNLSGAVSYALTTPLLMLRSGDDPAVLGAVLAVGGAGGVAGALVVGAVGARVGRVPLVLGGTAVGSAAGPLLMGIAQTPWLWAASAFAAGAALPAVNSAYQAIWQARVPTQVQGRVFGARRLLAQSSLPLGLLVAGPVVDHLLTPLFENGGAEAASGLLGEGRTGATALLLGIAGLAGLAAALLAAASPRLRRFDEPAREDAPSR